MSALMRVLALIAFVLALFKVDVGFSLLYVGLALWVASTLVDWRPARSEP